jgi:hypothetical protein
MLESIKTLSSLCMLVEMDVEQNKLNPINEDSYLGMVSSSTTEVATPTPPPPMPELDKSICLDDVDDIEINDYAIERLDRLLSKYEMAHTLGGDRVTKVEEQIYGLVGMGGSEFDELSYTQHNELIEAYQVASQLESDDKVAKIHNLLCNLHRDATYVLENAMYTDRSAKYQKMLGDKAECDVSTSVSASILDEAGGFSAGYNFHRGKGNLAVVKVASVPRKLGTSNASRRSLVADKTSESAEKESKKADKKKTWKSDQAAANAHGKASEFHNDAAKSNFGDKRIHHTTKSEYHKEKSKHYNDRSQTWARTK